MYLFADETKLMKRVKSRKDSAILQKDMSYIKNWSTTWFLNFHSDKCHVLTLGKPQKIEHGHNFCLGDKEPGNGKK